MKYIMLQRVSINPYTRASKNEAVALEELDEGFFKVTKGATDCKRGRNKERDYIYPMEEWESVLGSYLDKGFTPIDDTKREVKEITETGDYAPIRDKSFRNVLAEFVRLNNEFFEENYSKNIKDVSRDNIDIVQKTITELSQDLETVSVSDFNDALMNTIWTYVPRRMNHLDRLVAHKPDDFESIIVREQEMLDHLVQELQTGESMDKKLDILTANNIRERQCSKEEIDYIRDLISRGNGGNQNLRFSRAWAVTNDTCEKNMNEYLASEGFEIKPDEVCFDRPGISYLWHGTAASNLWSIMKNGLYLNPALIKADVRICGKAYGYGSYFAPCVYKSLGYANSNGFSYNRDLGGRAGYMLLFKVATGNPWYIYRDKKYSRPNHWEDFHKDHPGMHCCWAESGDVAKNPDYRLRWDEVIVYQQCQSSLAYVVEVTM